MKMVEEDSLLRFMKQYSKAHDAIFQDVNLREQTTLMRVTAEDLDDFPTLIVQ